MPRTSLQKTYADFRKGFVSIANPLQYPDGTLKDIVNFDIKENGTLYRRPGLEFADQNSLLVNDSNVASRFGSIAMTMNLWNNVDNQGDVKIAVIQVAGTLYFYSVTTDGIDMSTAVSSPIDLGISSSGWNTPIAFANGAGKFFIAHPSIKPCYLSYDNGNIYLTSITIRIRDLNVWEGKDIKTSSVNYTADQVTGYTKDSTLFPQHEYNLRNGGWPIQATVADNTSVSSVTTGADPVTYTHQKMGFYPPISISFWYGKAGQGTSVDAQNSYSPWMLENDFTGTSTAPVGRKIVDAEYWFRQGNGTTLLDPSDPFSFSYIKQYNWTQYPSTIAFYAGRVWYAGAKGYSETGTNDLNSSYYKLDNLDITNTIYYSQVINDNLSKVSKCYQDADPTAQDINQLVATDGGTISIKEIGEIYSLAVYGTSLVVFSDQGVWAITGKDANSFEATNYSVIKISEKPPASRTSINTIYSNLYYVATDALYIITQDKVTGSPLVEDISSPKIKTFYANITNRAKQNCKLIFDRTNRVLYMFYNETGSTYTTPVDITDKVYNKCLVFNEDLGCYYKYEIGVTADTLLLDGFYLRQDTSIKTSVPITLNGNPVTVNSVAVTLDYTYVLPDLNNIQFLTGVRNFLQGYLHFRISKFTDVSTWKDWGNDYSSYVETGFDSAGDIMRNSKKAPVLISHMEITEDGFEVNPNDPTGQELILKNTSGCTLYSGWDWATSYGNGQQIYRFNRNYVPSGTGDIFAYGKEINSVRTRVRGKGHSLGLKLVADSGKNAKIIGLGILFTASKEI